MGRTTTTKYAVEMTVPGFYITPACWQTRQAGRANDANLAEYVRVFEASTQPGGCNEHLGITKVSAAQIVLNDGSRKVVAEYLAEGVSRNGGND